MRDHAGLLLQLGIGLGACLLALAFVVVVCTVARVIGMALSAIVSHVRWTRRARRRSHV